MTLDIMSKGDFFIGLKVVFNGGRATVIDVSKNVYIISMDNQFYVSKCTKMFIYRKEVKV